MIAFNRVSLYMDPQVVDGLLSGQLGLEPESDHESSM